MRKLFWIPAGLCYVLALSAVSAVFHGELFAALFAAGFAGWGWYFQGKTKERQA
jgi:hypothetical protein